MPTPSRIIKELISLLSGRLDLTCQDVRVGLFYTGVKLSNGYGGVAYTMRGLGRIHDRMVELAGRISGMHVDNVMALAEEEDYVLASIGVAAINAASQYVIFGTSKDRYKVLMDVDCFDVLEIRPNDTVVMVGAFCPYVKRLRGVVERLLVYDENKEALEELGLMEPDISIREALRNASVTIITGSALVNKTMDGLLDASKDAREIIVLGPTASTIPEPFFSRNVKAVGGIFIEDADLMLRVVSEAGGARSLLSTCARKYALVKGAGV